MTLAEALILLIILFFSVTFIITYARRIGEQQEREWIEFKQRHPHLFRPEVSKTSKTYSTEKPGMNEEEKVKYVKNLWKDHPQKEELQKHD